MKQNYTHITMILDRSGSMENIKTDVIGGFNQFIKEQKAVPGAATLSLIQFDNQDSYEIIHDFVPLTDVPELTEKTFVPRGMTPLLDALGRGIVDLGEKLDRLPEEERPEFVVFVIITDGQENNSKEYKRERIMEMIAHQQDTYNWQIVFLSCDRNAIKDAQDYGINMAAIGAFDKDAAGVKTLYSTLSANTVQLRSGKTKKFEWSGR